MGCVEGSAEEAELAPLTDVIEPYETRRSPTVGSRGFKCPGWKRINAERCRIFEGPRKPELTEAQKTLAKKRQELARVLEWLGSPGLMLGIARELRKHVVILEREIAELEQA